MSPPPVVRKISPPPGAQEDYEFANMSSGDMSKKYGVTQTQVIEWASLKGWQRNRTDVAAREKASLLRLRDIERVSLEMQARVLSSHRADIKSMKAVALNLWSELEGGASSSDDEAPDLMHRVKIMEKLTAASKTLFLLERQAYGIEGAIQDPEAKAANTTHSPAEDAMNALLGKFASVLAKDITPPPEVIENEPTGRAAETSD